MTPLSVSKLYMSTVGYILVLKSNSDGRTLPIHIAPPEAQSISIAFNHVKIPRPMTHDLFKSIMDALEARLDQVVITDVKNNVFYSKMVLRYENQKLEIDSRPSDAIAIALRMHVPVYATNDIMERASFLLPEDNDHTEKAEVDESSTDKLEKKDDFQSQLDILQEKLAQAVHSENYEKAANLRDEIHKLKLFHENIEENK